MNKDEIIDLKPINNYSITAKIIQTLTRQESSFPFNKYIEYKVYLTSSNSKNWILRKRYKCFKELHSNLKKKVINLPKFPEKKLFNMTQNTILERKSLLENYLNYILNNLNLTLFPKILDFIEVEKEELILSRTSIEPTKRNPYSHRRSKSFTILEENFFSNYVEADLNPIEDFLLNLEEKTEEKSKVIKKFWKFLQKQKDWPKFKREDILKLFYGNGNRLKGVLFHCGNTEENDLGAETCLQFLANLLRYEFNPECEMYVYVLKMAKLNHIMKINFNYHLKSKKNNKDCFQILKYVVIEDKAMITKKIFEDPEIEKLYENWLISQV